ncbi:unnamed protein product [Cuscuta europaea]|uniref:HAT C-terminal dimerisation domain-containing protein n=1 Tax=Cuscuta europaea TaxID=41803 RepID=A0A9P1EB87_CUSEU|nr:unnamed protein product [Cuscuta europaea]
MRVLSLTCSSSGCERNWSVFEQIHTKRRNRLGMKKLNDLVFVKYNATLKARFDSKDITDPIALDNIDDCNEWLAGNVNASAADDSVFSDDEGDGLTWGAVSRATGAEEPIRYTRKHSRNASSSTTRRLVDEESEGEIEEDVGEYKSDNGEETDSSFNDE